MAIACVIFLNTVVISEWFYLFSNHFFIAA